MQSVEHSDQQSTIELLRSFFAGCERGLKFLETEYGFHAFYGLCEYQNGFKIIKPIDSVSEHSLDDGFSALMRYESDMRCFEIEYTNGVEGDDYKITSHLFYDQIERFEPSEILMAARKASDASFEKSGLSNIKNLNKCITQITQIFSAHANVLVAPNDKVIERARGIRAVQLEQAIRRKFEENLEVACKLAAKAFLEKNYTDVIEILEPYKSYLRKSDLKKLEQAKKHIQP